MPLIRKLYKSGNSRHATLPRDYLKVYERKYGVLPSEVSMEVSDSTLTIKLMPPQNKR